MSQHTTLALDCGHLYWANYGANAIGLNRDGTEATPDLVIGGGDPGWVAVDRATSTGTPGRA